MPGSACARPDGPARSSVRSRILQSADDRLAIDVDDTAVGQALLPILQRLPHCVDAVGGIDCIELRYDLAAVDAQTFRVAVEQALDGIASADVPPGRRHEIAVVYDDTAGPDLGAVCERLAISRAEFMERHTAAEYVVAMLGFTPGFAYLDGLDPALEVPRLATPRVRVAGGSVGLAGSRCGIYALPGPGGWQIVGRTDAALYRNDAERPFRFRPGDRLRFVPAKP